jgi:hypothetical protein
VGAARVKLDPPVGIAMMGYGNRVGRSIGAHDDLAAQAMVFYDGTNKAAIVSVDLLAIGCRIADEIRNRVASRTDIPADAIMVAATHTHSGPTFNIWATPKPDARDAAPDRDLDWERALPEKIAVAITQANANLQPAKVGASKDQRFTLGTNRRLMRPDGTVQLAANYAGVSDAKLKTFCAFDENRQLVAFALNYPCHGVVLCEDNLRYSRDWIGFALDEIEKRHGANGASPIGIFLQGATGNIDPRSRGSFEVATEQGRIAARSALDGLEAAKLSEHARVRTTRIPLKLTLKDLEPSLSLAHNYLAQTEASLRNHRGGEGYQLKRLKDHHAQAVEALHSIEEFAEANRRDRRVDVDRGELATSLTIITVGEAAFVGIPGEPFVELGLAVSANPYFRHTFIVGYCNDLIGYIPTHEAYGEGGYEVDTARVAAGSGEAIVNVALAELARLAGNGA